MTEQPPETGFDVPDDADESQVPDAGNEDMADQEDPAFDDDADPSLEAPLEGEPEGEDPDDDEPEELLEADEQVDPEEHDEPTVPPGLQDGDQTDEEK